MPQVSKRSFTVQSGSLITEILGRLDAVKHAKELSRERGRALVEREDGAVQMSFRHGSLETLVSSAPHRRRR